MQEALLHKFLLFPAALVYSLSGDQRRGADVLGAAALPITRIHWTLKKCSDPCISVACQGRKNASSDLFFLFFGGG